MCPTCRHLAVIDDQSPRVSPIVKSIIENLHVRCKNQLDREEAIKEQSQHGNTGSSLQVKYASVEDCDWKGNLGEYNAHLESTCPLVTVNCRADGCASRHLRGYMRSGYCQNSECVVISARSLLEKRKQLDMRMKSLSKNKCTVEATSTLMASAGDNKENASCSKYAKGFDSPQKKISPQKKASLNKEELPLQSQTPRLTKLEADILPTRVFVQADSPADLSAASVDSICKSKANGVNQLKIIPTDLGVIRDPVMNSVRFTTNFGSQDLSLTETKSLTRAESFASSHIGTLDGSDNSLMDTDERQSSDESISNSNKIILVPNQKKARSNDAFLLAAIKVLVDKELAKIQLKSSLEAENVKAMFVNRHIIEFCSSWMKVKPDALFDFVVYRPKSNEQINKIMCGIPGPKRTDWEGGLYPVLLEWNNVNLPPNCKFPKHFHHANVCPLTGVPMLSTFSSFEWHPEISIPEILFDLQQLLAHPNHKDTSINDENYQFKTRIQTSMYAPSSLLDTALEIEGFGNVELWQLVDGEALTCGGRREHNTPNARPKEPEFNGNFSLNGHRVICKAKCSCCVYGQSLWDAKREMRFLFGTGMFS